METLLNYLGKMICRITGWSYDDLPDYWSDKQVVIGFPHTSNMDGVISFCYTRIVSGNVNVLVKSDLFFWPMSSFLNAIGGIPVIRDKGSGFVSTAVREFQKRDKLTLAIVPEGTRGIRDSRSSRNISDVRGKDTVRIKTGFWNIAKGANVPVMCGFFDNKQKKITWVGHFIPGDDIMVDLIKIREMYQQHGYEVPLGDINQYKAVKPALGLHPGDSTIITDNKK